ncbi:MAG: hypothetical protein D6737_14255 [Chloroflexi bacterium]|nr:MAG: hypothetical protein D6737_14255 [Chloroflexota bacterium]
MLFIIIMLIGSLVVFVRTGLIIMGFYKEPILRGFERYGAEEPLFFPLPTLLFATGTLFISSGMLLFPLINWPGGIAWLFGLPLIWLGYFMRERRQLVLDYPQIFLSYPRWYYELFERTDRYERRYIAYMWLWLPRKLRLIYNGNTRAFFQWVDLVVMSNTVEEGTTKEHWPWLR